MQVKLAFMDDRKTKEQRDEIEREQRVARAAQLALAAAAAPTLPEPRARSSTPDSDDDPESESSRMPGSGHVLGPPTTNREEPPAYDETTG